MCHDFSSPPGIPVNVHLFLVSHVHGVLLTGWVEFTDCGIYEWTY